MPETQNKYRAERLGAPALSAALPVAGDRNARGTRQGRVENAQNTGEQKRMANYYTQITRCTSPLRVKARRTLVAF